VLYIPPVVLSAAITEFRALAGDIVTAHTILTNKLALVSRKATAKLLLTAKTAEEGTFTASACF